MLQGPEAGTVATFNNAGAAFGADVSVALADGLYFYTGDISKLELKHFKGPRASFNGAVNIRGVDIGVDISVSRKLKIGGNLWSVSGSAGIGSTPTKGSFNVNYGKFYNINKKAEFTFPFLNN